MMSDRLKQAILAFIKSAFPHIDRYALYNATVVSQSGDKFDLIPDSPLLPNLSGVPLRNGIPGLSVKVTPGGHVLVGFAEGDPQKPFVAGWLGDESAIQLNLTATTIVLNGGTMPVARVGDAIAGHTHIVTGSAGPFPVVATAMPEVAPTKIIPNGCMTMAA